MQQALRNLVNLMKNVQKGNISDDGKEWYCTGRVVGCYFPVEKPDVLICGD
jgi:hypothetical protein